MALVVCLGRTCNRHAKFVRYFAKRHKQTPLIKVGEKLPNVVLYENTPTDTVHVHELFRGKKGILFSVPGAFTPGCEQAHIPEYLNNFDKFKSLGYEELVCVSVNDPFVMHAWCKHVGAEGKIRMLADMKGELTQALNMELDCTLLLGGMRSKRYSMLIDDNTVTEVNLDPDGTGLACLLCIQRLSDKIHKQMHIAKNCSGAQLKS